MSYRRFVFASDFHGSHHDRAATRAFLRFCEQWNPDIRVFGGDLWDFAALRKGASEDEKRESLLGDYADGLQFLRDLKPQFYLRGNHCFDEATELLTDGGFVPITEITEAHNVAQVDDSGALTYARPLALHRNESVEKLIEIRGAYTCQRVTHGHKVIVNGQKMLAKDLLGRKIPSSAIQSGGMSAQRTAEDENWIRLITWVVMDGTIVDGRKYDGPNSKKRRIQFKLSLEHKISRLTELLLEMGVPFTLKPAQKTGCNKLQPYCVRIYGEAALRIFDYLGGAKEIPAHWSDLPLENLNTFIRELPWTDGYAKDASIAWASICWNNVNRVQTWCVRNGVNCAWTLYGTEKSGFPNGKPQYTVRIQYRELKHEAQKLRVREVEYGKAVYCVTMPLGTVIARIDGRTAVTGNCERLWDLAGADKGVLSDCAIRMTGEIETEVKRLKCRMLPYHKREGVLRIGSLKMLHGYAAGINAARKHAWTYGSCLFGHIHSIDHVTLERTEKTMARAVGCLARLDMEYNRAQIGSLRHAHGWAYGVVDERRGNFHVWQAERVGEKFLCATELIEL